MPKEDHTSSDRSFDDLARAVAEGSISRRGALKLFAGSAIAALIPSRALAQQQKVTICHKPGTPAEETKEVSQSAVDSHLRHGDQLGPCQIGCPDGRVELSNGTCAKTCSSALECSASCSGCGAANSGNYCYASPGSQTPCSTDSQCPRGEFCFGNVCVAACS